ncbi:MAG: hypothetical protein M1840_001502 [Geoglossum simile]|nr:MAG: hypothetical protein M1840_001502 [Geoglossum simile]
MGLYLAGHWQQDLFKSLSWFVPRNSVPKPLNANQKGAAYRAPSWSWVSINSTVRIEKTLWWSPKRGESPCKSQTEEYLHWERQYTPALVEFEISNPRNVDAYISVGTGSFIEIEAFCRSLFLAPNPIGYELPDGPGGALVKEISLDLEDRSLCYLEKPPDYRGYVREVVMAQICKGCRGDRNVYALLLEPESQGCYRRIGRAALGNYNLGNFLESQKPIIWDFHMHPRQRDEKLDELKTREWEATKWARRRLKLV